MIRNDTCRRTTMLKSYEAIYDNGTLRWLGESPSLKVQRVLVVVETEQPQISGEAAGEGLLQETAGAWGKQSAARVDALIADQRDQDWPESIDR